MSTATETFSRISWESVPLRTEATRASLEQVKSIPQRIVVTFLAIDWFSSVAQFRNAEVACLRQDGKFQATLDEHRLVLSQLIYQGEMLVAGINQSGLVQDVTFTPDDIRATIESLRETFRGVHGPHNHPETTKAILSILEAA